MSNRMELKTLFTQDSEGEPLSNALCYLYERGTKTMATVYDAGGESIGQPFSSNAVGMVMMMAENGVYDFRVVKAPIDFTMGVQFFDTDITSAMVPTPDTGMNGGGGPVGVMPSMASMEFQPVAASSYPSAVEAPPSVPPSDGYPVGEIPSHIPLGDALQGLASMAGQAMSMASQMGSSGPSDLQFSMLKGRVSDLEDASGGGGGGSIEPITLITDGGNYQNKNYDIPAGVSRIYTDDLRATFTPETASEAGAGVTDCVTSILYLARDPDTPVFFKYMTWLDGETPEIEPSTDTEYVFSIIAITTFNSYSGEDRTRLDRLVGTFREDK